MENNPALNNIYAGDCLNVMGEWPDAFIQTCVTSPPYWGLRDYGSCDCASGRYTEGQGTGGDINYRSGRPLEGCPKCSGSGRLPYANSQLGLEQTPDVYVARMVDVFREVRRVLRDDGTLWLNLGDSYTSGGRPDRDNALVSQSSGMTNRSAGMSRAKTPAGLKPKDLVGIPWRVAFALQADGWYLRSDIIWAKPNPMPESVTDRPTKAHEYLFLLTKDERYFYDAEAIKEPVAESTIGRGPVDFGGEKGRNYKPEKGDPNYRGGNEQWGRTFDYKESCINGRNKRSVWTVATMPYSEAHFATFPPDLIKPCILAGSKTGDIVFDPFMGAGTTALVAAHYDRKFIGTELNPQYVAMAEARIANETAQMKMAL